MSSPSPPKPQKINPYEGLSSDADINRARQALGISNINSDDDKRQIDEWLLNERWEKESGRDTFTEAYRGAKKDGSIERGDRTQWALDQALGAEQTLIYGEQSAGQQQQLQDQFEQSQLAQQEAAEAQRQMMEDMMNQPVYMPKQQQMPVVQKPQVQNDPILPAPAPNTPMSIAAPPAPELANTGSRMAIVRTPASTQARSRRATRGTSSLRN